MTGLNVYMIKARYQNIKRVTYEPISYCPIKNISNPSLLVCLWCEWW